MRSHAELRRRRHANAARFCLGPADAAEPRPRPARPDVGRLVQAVLSVPPTSETSLPCRALQCNASCRIRTRLARLHQYGTAMRSIPCYSAPDQHAEYPPPCVFPPSQVYRLTQQEDGPDEPSPRPSTEPSVTWDSCDGNGQVPDPGLVAEERSM